MVEGEATIPFSPSPESSLACELVVFRVHTTKMISTLRSLPARSEINRCCCLTFSWALDYQ